MLEPTQGTRPRYLIIGHVTRDGIDTGDARREAVGGTASYAGLTALAYGADVRLLTSCREEEVFPELMGILIHRLSSRQTSTFENRYEGDVRLQRVLGVADPLQAAQLPEAWRSADLIHLAPVAGETDSDFFSGVSAGLRCATLQGWMREWEADGGVRKSIRQEVFEVAQAADVVAFSLEDIGGDETLAEQIAERCPVTAVTDGASGCRVYWNGHLRGFPAPKADAADPTGAGDIFSAVFFLRYLETRDPYEAARMANRIAARSVTRAGLAGIPRREEILEAKLVIEQP